jgi:dihydroneopterin aldolase
VITRIELIGLRFGLNIGIHDFEKTGPQPYEVDILLDVDPGRVLLQADDIDLAFDYDPIRTEVLRLAGAERFRTQERFLTRLLRFVAGFPEIGRAEIAVRKTAVYRDARSVGLRAGLSRPELDALLRRMPG